MPGNGSYSQWAIHSPRFTVPPTAYNFRYRQLK